MLYVFCYIIHNHDVTDDFVKQILILDIIIYFLLMIIKQKYIGGNCILDFDGKRYLFIKNGLKKYAFLKSIFIWA